MPFCNQRGTSVPSSPPLQVKELLFKSPKLNEGFQTVFFTHYNDLCSMVLYVSFWFSFRTDFCCFLVKAAVISSSVPLLEQPPTLILAVCLLVLALVPHHSHRKINTHSLSCTLKGSLHTCSLNFVLFMVFAVLISFCSVAFVIWRWLFLVVVCVVIDLNVNTLVV